jgi:indolepyruvate ferredoxin oxidoreductase
MAIDPRFQRQSGVEVFNGNELLVKGCLEVEGGIHLCTGYPGSPVATFFDVLGDVKDLIKKAGIRAFQANNEALGAAALNGAQMAPCRALAAMKSVGVHVAADALAIGNLAGAHPEGGAVLIAGDDPWCDSTQVPADSRFLFEHLRMAVVEPGTIQELKDWIDLSFKLSRAAGVYIGYVVTTAQADGGGSVVCKPNQYPTLNQNQKIALETAKIDLDKVLLPPRTWQHELKMAERHEVTIQAARELGLNRVIPATRSVQRVSPIGFIVCGMSGPYLAQVLRDIGLEGVFPVLQMGMQYPTDVEIVREFAGHCRDMIVIEERRSFLEKNIREGFYKKFDREEANDLSSRLYGKQFPTFRGTAYQSSANHAVESRSSTGIPETRGLNPSVLAQILIPFIKSVHELPADLRNGKLSAELERLKATGKRKLEVLGSEKVAPIEAGSAASSDVHIAQQEANAISDEEERIIARTPTFCPGCPHRDSSAVLMELRKNLADADYMKRRHNQGPVDLVAHGDTGCYTMLMFQPTEQLMHNYSGMGLGAGTGSGIDPFITNKQIVFMGDGTFFHSGAVAISNAIQAGQELTFIILENKITAMTGHQEHAGTDQDLLGSPTDVQEIFDIVKGMKGTSPLTVEKVDPADRNLWRKALERTIMAPGVKVLIADKECGITLHRRLGSLERKEAKKHGFLPQKSHMNITPEVCEHCLECTKATACPGLITVETDYGRKIDTDLTWCVNDGACDRVTMSNDYGKNVKPCPSFEQITVIRKKRRRYTLPNMELSKLPEATRIHKMSDPGDTWRVHMAGVGGMGIGVVGALLVRAGHFAGYQVVFSDKKGLAIRNGGVYSQITWIKTGPVGEPRSGDILKVPPSESRFAGHGIEPTSGLIPYGQADLLLGIDVLEAARAVDPREHFRIATPDKTSVVLNLFKQPTVSTLLGKQDFDPYKLRDRIAEHCVASNLYAKNLSALCEQRLGSKLFVNILMLGVAYQLGYVPLPASAIAKAIKETIRRDVRRNLKAFNIGRKLALEPMALPDKPHAITWEQLLTQKTRILRKTRARGETHATAVERLVTSAINVMPALSDRSKYDLTLRIYDIYQYENEAYAKRYIDVVRSVYRRDSADQKYLATQETIWNLSRLMMIKDEPYVAYLLTRYEKIHRDALKYNIDSENGDEVRYKWHNVPEVTLPVIGKLRLPLTTRPWMHKIIRHFKFVRKLPTWHRKERDFCDWYIGLIDRIDLNTTHGYQTAVKVLGLPEEANGYREVRYPKMDRVKQDAEAILGRAGPAQSMSSDVNSRSPMPV